MRRNKLINFFKVRFNVIDPFLFIKKREEFPSRLNSNGEADAT